MTETVHYNIAKLLAEKGFPQNNIDYETISTIGKDENDDFIFGNTYSCPTIAQVIMWLYEKHSIWISVTQELGATITFCYQVMGERISTTYKAYFNSPTEAYSSAITHVLTNLNK